MPTPAFDPRQFPAPGEASGPAFDPKQYAAPGEGYTGDPGPGGGAAGTVGRRVLGGAIPLIGGALTADGIGATIGTLIEPGGGTIAGGLIGHGIGLVGGLLAAGGLGAGQQALLNANPEIAKALGQDDATREADEREHPIAAAVGDLLPQLAVARPSGALFDLLKGGKAAATAALQLGTGAALQAGVEGGQELLSDGKLDPTRLALAGAGGAILNKPWLLGKAFHGGALGKAAEASKSSESQATDATDPIPPATDAARPTNLLALPAPDQPEEVGTGSTRTGTPRDAALLPDPGDFPINAPDQSAPVPLALPNPDAPIDAQFEDVGTGATRAATPPTETPPPLALTDQRGTSGPTLYGGDNTQPAPQPTQDLDFTGKAIQDRLAQANTKADGTPVAMSPFARKLALDLSNHLQKGDLEGAQALVDKHVADKADDAYAGSKADQSTTLAAIDELAAYRKQNPEFPPQTNMDAVQGVLAPRPPPADVRLAPPNDSQSVQQALVKNDQLASQEPLDPTRGTPGPVDPRLLTSEPAPVPFTPEMANAAADQSRQTQDAQRDQELKDHRSALLHQVLSSGSNNPTKDFQSELLSHGHKDLGLSVDEAASIGRYADVKAAFKDGDPTRRPIPGEETVPDWRALRDAELEKSNGQDADAQGREVQPAADERQAVGPQADVPGDAVQAERDGAPQNEDAQGQVADAPNTQQPPPVRTAESKAPPAAKRPTLSLAKDRAAPDEASPVPKADTKALFAETLARAEAENKGSTKDAHFVTGIRHELGKPAPDAYTEGRLGPEISGRFEAGRQAAIDTMVAHANRDEPTPASTKVTPKDARQAEDGMVKEPTPTSEGNREMIAGWLQKGLIDQSEHKMLATVEENGDPTMARPLTPREFKDRAMEFIASKDAATSPKAPQSRLNSVALRDRDSKSTQDLEESLRQEMIKMGIDKHTNARLVETLFNKDATTYAGDYADQLISIARDHGDVIGTLRHESVHLMRDLGLIKDQEYRRLVRYVRENRPDLVANVERLYSEETPTAKTEETVAELFRTLAAQADRAEANPAETSFISRIADRIVNFAKGLANFMRGEGFGSSRDLIDAMRNGQVGAREGSPVRRGNYRPEGSEPLYRRMDPTSGTPEERAAKVEKVTAADVMEGFGGKVRRIGLNLTTVHQIAETYRHTPIGPLLDQFADALNRAVATKSDFIHASAAVHDDWMALPKAHRADVGAALIKSTLAASDGRTDPANAAFKALSPEGQKVYGQVLDHFARQRDQFKQAMADAINRSDASPEDKASSLAALEKKLSRPVYFPLMRFGDFINVATNAKYDAAVKAHEDAIANHNAVSNAVGTTAEQLKASLAAKRAASDALDAASSEHRLVTAHENLEAQNLAKRQMEAEGYNVTPSKRADFEAHTRAPATAFTSRFDDILKADSDAHPDRAAGNRGLQMMMHELANSMQPEGSALRNAMARKSVQGYSEDALRTYSVASRRNSHLLAAMQSGEEQRTVLASIDKRIADLKTQGKDTRTLTDVRNQVNKQYTILGKYASTPLPTFLSNATYAYMLGGSPSFMIMHLMQTPMVTAPMMGAHFPIGRVIAELLKSAGEASPHVAEEARRHALGIKGDMPFAFAKNDFEQAALRYANERATIASTHADGFRATGDNDGTIDKVGAKIMGAASFLPHYTERMNRISTLMAAARLARTDPRIGAMLSDERYDSLVKESPWLAKHSRAEVAAMRYANEITLSSHVDYSADNAPYVFQAHGLGLTKMMFQFQKYQQAMLYSMVKNTMNAFDKTLSGEERSASIKTLAGVVGTHALLTGAMGLPGYGVAALMLNLYHKLLGDKDQPFDADDQFHELLNRTLGKDAGDLVGRGLLYAPGVKDVVPADITDRLGMGDLLASPKQINGADQVDRNSVVQYIGTTLGGPAASLLGQFVQAYNEHETGDNYKAVELMVPKVMRDIMRTARFQNEGVTTSSDNPVVKPGELSFADLTAQAMGFTPQKVETAYANRASIQDAKAEMDARRKVLLKEFTDGTLAGDSDKVSDIRAKIEHFNAERRAQGEYPELINGSSMMRAVQQRRLAAIRLKDGVSLSPKEKGLIDQYAVDDPNAPTP